MTHKIAILPLVFLSFFCLLAQAHASSSPWQVAVTKDKEIVPFGDTLNVKISITYPQDFEPNLFDFLMRQKRISEYGYFQLLHHDYEKSSSEVVITLQLRPEKIGTLIFTPGIFSFSPKDKTVNQYELLIPAFSITSKGLYAPPKMVPPLPFNPEKEISINEESFAASFENDARKTKEAAYNEKRSLAKSHAWTALAILFFVASLGVLIYWFLKEYERVYKSKKPFIKKRNLNEEFKQLQVSNEPLKVRLGLLSELLRAILSEKAGEGHAFIGLTTQELFLQIQQSSHLRDAEKNALKELFATLDTLQFSGSEVSSEEMWQKLSRGCAFLFEESKLH